MKSLNGVARLILAGVLASGLACSKPAGTTGNNGQTPPPRANDVPGTASAETAASSSAAPAPAPVVDAGDILKFMPATCAYNRVYMNVTSLLRDGGGASVDRILSRLMPTASERYQAAFQVLSAAGVKPLADLQELAVCTNDDNFVLVLRYEAKPPSPARAFAKAFLALQADSGYQLVGVGDNVVVISTDRAVADAAAKGPGPAPEFADAKKHVVWGKSRENDVELTVDEVGSDYEIRWREKASKTAKADAERKLDTRKNQASSDSPLHPLQPALKSAKVTVAGGKVTITMKLATSALTALFAEVDKAPIELTENLVLLF
ncbi:MAG: hypothetical protein HOV80_02350 [Polyangiaceae bacterium]|nr:hypothetical protein [Polyangiaceae bacterium]